MDPRTASVAHVAPVIGRLVAYASCILVAAAVPYHLAHGSTAYLGLFEDDYFYYAGVADHLVRDGMLTYDGVHMTNGFHPLWLAVLVLLRALFGRFGTAFYVAMTVVALGCLIVTYELSKRLARALGASTTAAPLIAALYAVGTARLMTAGMEPTVAVPLFLWLLIEATKDRPMTLRRAAWLGLLSSLAILARLDIALAVAMLIAAYLAGVRPPLRTALTQLLAFGAGGILLPIYLLANAKAFGAPLPVSAMAKQLYSPIGFNLWYARSVALGSVFGPTMAVLLPAGVLALFVLWRRSPRVRPHARLTGAIALGFAFLLFGVNALSGWIFFGWYAYPMAPATIAAAVFVWEAWGAPVAARGTLATGGAAVVLAVQLMLAATFFIQHGPRWSVADNSMLSAGYDLERRVSGLQGTFGMGAIAGVVAYVVDRPFVQLEGIMADRRMVEHIRHDDRLDVVLREYGVDYMVVSLATVRAAPHDGCYTVTQPNAEWAGQRTRKLRGDICEEPILHFTTPRGVNAWSIFPDIETLVWDVRGARWRRPDGSIERASGVAGADIR